ERTEVRRLTSETRTYGGKDPDSLEGVRPRADRPGGGGHRPHRREDRRAGVGADSAADQAVAVDGAAQPAHRQEEPGAVRAEDAQAAHRHPRLAPPDGGRVDEAGFARRAGRRKQGAITDVRRLTSDVS